MKLLATLFLACGIGFGQSGPPVTGLNDFKPYPGAKLDEKASQGASSERSQSRVYTSGDSFDRLYAFYKGLYKEVKWPVPPPQLASGKPVQWAFFILDDGKDLAHSKAWLKIQRPFILTIGEGDQDFKGVRDVSAIQVVHRLH